MGHVSRILVVATATTALAGCSDGAMSSEAYFSELETIFQTTDDASDELGDRTRGALENVESAEEATEVFRPLLEDLRGLLQTALDELEDLAPPEEVADEHTAFTDSIRDTLRELQRLLDDYDTLGFDGVWAAIGGQDFQRLGRASDEACANLQNAAQDSGVDVDLNCEI